MSEENELTENDFGYEIAIQEMRYLIEDQSKSLELAKSTAQNVLSAASLIIALVGILPVLNASQQYNHTQCHWGLILLAAVLYTLLIIVCVYILGLQNFHGPIAADWPELYNSFVKHTDKTMILKTRLSAYLNALELNKPVVNRKTRLANLAAALLPAIVILLFLAALIQ